MQWVQRSVQLPAYPRGFHLITDRITNAMREIGQFRVGLLHVFLQHTSASLLINENADSDVPADLESVLDSLAPEDFNYRHSSEGPDDMPAHVKTALLGCSLSLPVQAGRLALGTWQGIFLCEHRDRAAGRTLLLTLHGQPTE